MKTAKQFNLNFDNFKYKKIMSLYPFKDEGAFNEWLLVNNLSNNDFLKWFETEKQINENCPWIDYLNNNYNFTKEVLLKYSNPFCVLVDFIIEKALADFSHHQRAVKQSCENIEPAKFNKILKNELINSFSNMISPTLTLELNVAKVSNKLVGNSSREQHLSFIKLLSEKDYIKNIFQEYPVLLKRLIQKVEISTKELSEVYLNMVKDNVSLCEHYGETGKFQGFTSTSGDSHLNGQQVRIVQFENFKLVYKPRNLKADINFQNLLLDLNQNAGTSFKKFKVLDFGSHGWSDFIAYKPCNNKNDLVEFYRNLGHYIMVLYLFNGADFHIENIVCNKEHPILIDLESIFHFNPFTKKAFYAEDHTVMDSSILPYKIKFSNHESFIDVSALGYTKNQIINDTLSENFSNTTNPIHTKNNKRKVLEVNTFHSLSNDFGLSIDEINSHLCKGFKDLYLFFLKNNSWINENKNFRKLCLLTYRCILRPTSTYTTLLRCSYHPDYLRNENDLKLFLNQKLWKYVSKEPFDKKLISIEVDDLIKNDIPVFYFKPIHELSSDNRIVKNTKEFNLVKIIETINKQLSNKDLKYQMWLITATMKTTEAKIVNNGFKINVDTKSKSIVDSYINSISKSLYLLSIKSSKQIYFKDYKYLEKETCTIINQNKLELFNGDLGTLLYLLYYSHIYNKKEIKEITLSTIDSIIFSINDTTVEEIGGYIGFGSVIYSFTKTYQITKDIKIIPSVILLIDRINNAIEKDKHFDVLYGSAGALLSMLNAYECFKESKILSTCIKCGNHLIDNFKKSKSSGGWTNIHDKNLILGGYSHGVSGIAYALAKLSKVTNLSKYAKFADIAINYEDALYDKKSSNYIDLRNNNFCESASKHTEITAWCNGLVGIAIARIDMFVNNYLPNRNSQFKNEIKRNVSKILDKGMGNNHSLCHGDASALEYLFLVSNHFPKIFSKSEFNTLINDSIYQITQSKQKNGIKFDLFSPGLMLGSIGFSYQLMRFKHPKTIGNLLLLN